MERQQYSQLATNIAYSWVANKVREKVGSFFYKSDAAYLGKDYFSLVNELKPIRSKAQMARYRKRGYKRRKLSSKRRRYGKRRYGKRRGSLSRRVRGISNFLRNKGIRNVESKYYSAFGGAATPAYADRYDVARAPIIGFTKGISNGNDYTSRNGAKIFIRKIKLYLMFTASSSAPYPEQYIKWCVVRDKKPDSQTNDPILNDVVFNNIGTSASGQAYGNIALMTFRDVNNRYTNRFSWLASGVHKIVNENGTGEKTVFIKKNIRVNQPCYYGTSQTDVDRGAGHIYLYAYSTSGSSTPADSPTIQFAYRVYFTDV